MRKPGLMIFKVWSLLLAAALMISCEGDTGDPGPAGAPGAKGADGKGGPDGGSGKDAGERLNETYGQVTVDFKGVRPNGKEFTYTQVYRYTPTNLYHNSVYFDEVTWVRLQRFNDIDRRSRYESISNFLPSAYAGTYDLEFELMLSTTIKFPEENKAMDMTISDEGSYLKFGRYKDALGNMRYEGNLEDAEILSSPDFPEKPGQYGYKFTGTVPGEHNSTRKPLQITVTADVIVFEEIWWD